MAPADDRLGAPVAPRAAQGTIPTPSSSETVYYMAVFAYDTEPRAAQSAHTFATFVKSNGRSIEAHTISWLPRTNAVRLLRRPEPGVNLDLRETFKRANATQAQVHEWGPYQIKPELFTRALKQIDRLASGGVLYKALDNRGRPETVSNCIHAVSDVAMDNGLLETGTNFGVDASAMVVEHLTPWIVDATKRHPWINEKLGIGKEVVIEK
jgi:hypothetical protein